MMNQTLIIIAIALIVAGIATIFVTRSDTTIPIPKPGNTSSSDNNSVTNSKYLHTNNNTGFESSLNR
jgi:hypothetical protein